MAAPLLSDPRRLCRWPLWLAVSGGVIAGLVAVFLGLAHDAQREFRLGDGDALDIGYALAVASSWFLIVCIPLAVILTALCRWRHRQGQ